MTKRPLLINMKLPMRIPTIVSSITIPVLKALPKHRPIRIIQRDDRLTGREVVSVSIRQPELAAVVVQAGTDVLRAEVDVVAGVLAVDPDGVVDVAVVVARFAEVDLFGEGGGSEERGEEGESCAGFHFGCECDQWVVCWGIWAPEVPGLK
jgi:hypothetical protein